MTKSAKFLSYVWYPVSLTLAVMLFGALLSRGSSIPVALYVPIVLVGLLIVTLEQWFPYRLDWRPRSADVKSDAAFLGIVQIFFPKMLAILAVLAISERTHANAQNDWWPHEWPLAAQVILMVLAVDFMRYWVHRACHRFMLLWRLHEVHHSPDILYSLNVGRFHPLEKILHFVFDSIPFLLLGVEPQVLAGYALLYSVNGFFQHSNIFLRYGWLNYFVGSAETHRWHHAKDPKTASCNFGNTTIVWDLLFGTWYLPKDKTLDQIGIMNAAYPKDFRSQMVTPFRSRKALLQGKRLREEIGNVLVTLYAQYIRLLQSRRIVASSGNPMAVQNALLLRIIRENNNSLFGRQHKFEDIDNYADFARQAPVGDYETLRPYVDAEIERNEKALTCEPPSRYARTSGTSGKPKDIPITASYLEALRRIQQTAVAYQHKACPEAFSGSILAITSPANEGVLSNGKSFGSASGTVSENTPALVREKFVPLAAALTISDSRVKYLLILRLALARRDITYICTANPTTMLTLVKLYREHESIMIDDVETGKFFLADKVPPEVWPVIESHLAACPQRAAELSRLQATTVERRIADLWPMLRLVVTWTCGSAGIAVQALRRELHLRTRILELGYLSSEVHATFTIGRRAETGMPTFDTYFFEFAEREKWDRGEHECFTLDRLRKGVDYYVIVTTPSGLYRYFMNDVVRVTGFLRRTPLLKFVQKGKGVTNITGEKLYEAQVLAAVREAMEEAGHATRFVMMLADEQAYCYRLYVEADVIPALVVTAFANAVEAKLMKLNIEYQSKRESDRLGLLNAIWLKPGAGEAYKHFCVQQGQREGQFKTVALAYRREFHFDIDAHAGENQS